MKHYLNYFFNEFDYTKADAACLLSAYDAVLQSTRATAILYELLAQYEETNVLTYNKEKSTALAECAGIHIYTAELLLLICMSRHLKTLYEKNGLDGQIYRDSMLDLKWKLEECKAVKGVCGTFVAEWFPGFFNLTRFALGRLQFEIIPFGHSYRKGDVVLAPESKVVNVHIPRTGTPLDRESCECAYAKATCFFQNELDGPCAFVCHSWLLYPEHYHILSPHGNVFRFMSEYEILRSGTNGGNDLWRLFDTDERSPDKLPADTSMRRRYIEYLKGGGKPGWGFGVRLSDQ